MVSPKRPQDVIQLDPMKESSPAVVELFGFRQEGSRLAIPVIRICYSRVDRLTHLRAITGADPPSAADIALDPNSRRELCRIHLASIVVKVRHASRKHLAE